MMTKLQKTNHALAEINARQAASLKLSARSIQANQDANAPLSKVDEHVLDTLKADYKRLQLQHEKVVSLQRNAMEQLSEREEQLRALLSENQRLHEEKNRYAALVEGFELTLSNQREIIHNMSIKLEHKGRPYDIAPAVHKEKLQKPPIAGVQKKGEILKNHDAASRDDLLSKEQNIRWAQPVIAQTTRKLVVQLPTEKLVPHQSRAQSASQSPTKRPSSANRTTSSSSRPKSASKSR
eukprot:TRINITY_DN8727_c0_g1_i2.p1 TRINITY_DN8727_c0_g1~~TRINITY_DN8727_c0_g1_i2.p1  ORF type:complete len:238 (+),score=52.96 TRINITY_DN8727_c0_g1_i2:191-904(+)